MRTTARYGEEQGYYEFGDVQEKSPYGYAPYSSPSYGQTPGYTPEKKDTQSHTPDSSKDTKATKKDVPTGPSSKKEDVKETEATKKIDSKLIDFSMELGEASEFIDSVGDRIRKRIKSNNAQEVKKLTSDIRALTNYLNTAKKSASGARFVISGLDKGVQKDKAIKKFQSEWSKYRDDFISLRDFFAKTQIPTTAASQAPADKELAKEREDLQDAIREYSISTNGLNSTIQEIAASPMHRRKRR